MKNNKKVINLNVNPIQTIVDLKDGSSLMLYPDDEKEYFICFLNKKSTIKIKGDDNNNKTLIRFTLSKKELFEIMTNFYGTLYSQTQISKRWIKNIKKRTQQNKRK
jgi:hypothetical protein